MQLNLQAPSEKVATAAAETAVPATSWTTGTAVGRQCPGERELPPGEAPPVITKPESKEDPNQK